MTERPICIINLHNYREIYYPNKSLDWKLLSVREKVFFRAAGFFALIWHRRPKFWSHFVAKEVGQQVKQSMLYYYLERPTLTYTCSHCLCRTYFSSARVLSQRKSGKIYLLLWWRTEIGARLLAGLKQLFSQVSIKRMCYYRCKSHFCIRLCLPAI